MTAHHDLSPATAAPATPEERPGRHHADRWWLPGLAAGLAAVAFLLLSVQVAAGTTQPLDDAAREYFRPGDRWGATQTWFGYVVDGLAPPITAPLLAAGSAIAAWRTHSLRPLVVAGATGSVAVASTLAVKAALDRSDGHGDLHGMADSYPSGHMVMLLVSAGCLVMLLAPRVRWLWIAVGVLAVLMGVAILVVAMHWLTDVVASVLLAVVLLAVTGVLRDWFPNTGPRVRP